MTKLSQRRSIYSAVTILLLSLFFICCSKDETNNGAGDHGEIFIKVLGEPAGYEQLNIAVDRISIHPANTAADFGWETVNTSSSAPFDLLNYQNGRSFQLVLSNAPAGKYDQIKIYYGPSTIRTDGIEYPLNFDPKIPFGVHTVSYNFQIVSGERLQLTCEYDVVNSIYKTGDFFYYFKPVVRLQNTMLSGWIAGSVLDSGTTVAPSRISTNTSSSSVSTVNEYPYGAFQLSDLPEDSAYVVTIVPDDSLLLADTIRNVRVVRQQGTLLGAIHLKYKR